MMKQGTVLFMGALAAYAVLSGCMRDYPAPVVERSILIAKRATLEPPEAYRVKAGDTLYSVAFRFGLDAKQLARWNGIQAPYTIYPGQRLVFAPSEGVKITATESAGPDTSGVEIEPLPPQREPVAQTDPEPEPTPLPELVPPEPAPESEAETPVEPVEDTVIESAVISSGDPQWQWPARGPLLSTFKAGDSARNGIDIAGEPGQLVVAAAAGKVVYSGNGLIGYGELIIIKHNDRFLSAYGHNRERLVAEGEWVKAQQQIAELGASGAPRPMLHFEIRVQGDPVDPLDYLPER